MIEYRTGKRVGKAKLVALYKGVRWLHYTVPDKLHAAYRDSDSVVTAWDGERLVGAGRALTDGHFNVYFPDIVVDPEYRDQGIASAIMARMMEKYKGIFNITAVAEDLKSEKFFWRCGLTDKKMAFRKVTPFSP